MLVFVNNQLLHRIDLSSEEDVHCSENVRLHGFVDSGQGCEVPELQEGGFSIDLNPRIRTLEMSFVLHPLRSR